MKITLPWPDRSLSPNARIHWAVKAKSVKNQRIAAHWSARNVMAQAKGVAPTSRILSITFYPPDKRRRDLDNLLASAKGAIDGFSEGVGVDDSEWQIRIQMGEPISGGRFTIEVLA